MSSSTPGSSERCLTYQVHSKGFASPLDTETIGILDLVAEDVR